MNKLSFASSGSVFKDERARPEDRKTTPLLPLRLFPGLAEEAARGSGCARSFPLGHRGRGGGGYSPGPRAQPGRPAHSFPGAIGGARASPSTMPRAPWFCRGSGKVCVRPCVPACPSWRHTLCGARPTFEQVQDGKEGQIRWDGGASATQDRSQGNYS